jgi:hypothetical protein
MKHLLLTILAIFTAPLCLIAMAFQKGRLVAANIADGTHAGSLTKKATAAITTRNLLVKFGATADLLAVNGVADEPLGPCVDEAGINDPATIRLLGIYPETVIMVGVEAVAAGADVYTAASGKVQDLPTANGTYWKVGKALTACTGDNDAFEVAHCTPVKLVINN